MPEHTDRHDPARADRLAHYLLRSVNKAIRDYGLIADGDRILVAVSGGKDSLTLLDLLDRRRRSSRERYELVAGSVASDHHCGAAVDPDWLARWCAARGIPLETEPLRVAREIADTTANRCFRCSWNRRKALFLMADRLGCGAVAYGHHADDRAETALMNLFYSGRFEDLRPRVPFFGGRLTVIRPLAYVYEREIRPFAVASGYPIRGEPCPDGAASRRSAVRRVLRELERDHRGVTRSIVGALGRAPGIEGAQEQHGAEP